TASVNLRKADADLAYDLQRNKTNQAVKAEEIQITVVEKQKMIEVQEKEIVRKQKELEATVSRPADAEKYRVQTLAEAEKFKLQTEAAGEAEAKRQVGKGEADANKSRGLAEADVILAQGTSTAEAMQKKADAWRAYNEAAVVQIFLENAPALARAIAEPLAKTEKIVIVSSGDSAGASKITKDVANVMAQLPEVVKALSGLDLNEFLGKLQKVGAKSPPTTDKK
ncbi:MAG TPA: flotillin family protein, partial [Verrucomicrobiae bacterium]|nr:flotillin family protein [Verrucomicrobiae bacterium]